MGFLQSAAWKRARRQALHDSNWQCARCGVSLVNAGRNAQVHHRKPRDRAQALWLEPLNLEPLCRACHRSHHNTITGLERGPACDVDGNPLDPLHPWNKGQGGGR